MVIAHPGIRGNCVRDNWFPLFTQLVVIAVTGTRWGWPSMKEGPM